MQHLLFYVLAACLLVSCAAGPPPAREILTTQAETDFRVGEAPNVTKGQAVDIACAVMKKRQQRTDRENINVTLGVHEGKRLWHVGYVDPLGGGWQVIVDADSARVRMAHVLRSP